MWSCLMGTACAFKGYNCAPALIYIVESNFDDYSLWLGSEDELALVRAAYNDNRYYDMLRQYISAENSYVA